MGVTENGTTTNNNYGQTSEHTEGRRGERRAGAARLSPACLTDKKTTESQYASIHVCVYLGMRTQPHESRQRHHHHHHTHRRGRGREKGKMTRGEGSMRSSKEGEMEGRQCRRVFIRCLSKASRHRHTCTTILKENAHRHEQQQQQQQENRKMRRCTT